MRFVTWAIATLLLLPAACALAQDKPVEPPQTTSVPERLYSLDVQDAPVRKVLDDLFARTNLKYVLNEYVTGFVTVKVKDVPFETALRAVMRATYTRLTYSKEEGGYVIFIPYNRYPRKEGEKGYETPRNFDLQLVSVREIVEILLKDAKVKFVIDPEVKGTVTVKFQNATWLVALTEILNAGDSPNAWRLDKDGTYHVYPKRTAKSTISLMP